MSPDVRFHSVPFFCDFFVFFNKVDSSDAFPLAGSAASACVRAATKGCKSEPLVPTRSHSHGVQRFVTPLGVCMTREKLSNMSDVCMATAYGMGRERV